MHHLVKSFIYKIKSFTEYFRHSNSPEVPNGEDHYRVRHISKFFLDDIRRKTAYGEEAIPALDGDAWSLLKDANISSVSSVNELLTGKKASTASDKPPNQLLNNFWQEYVKRNAYPGVGSSKDRLYVQKSELRKPSRWNVLSAFLWAIVKMRIMVRTRERLVLLHCCLFDDNYGFERKKLIQLWMAAELLKNEPLEDHGDRIFSLFEEKGYIVPHGDCNSRQTSLFKVDVKKVSCICAGAKAIDSFNLSLEGGKVRAIELADGWHISLKPSNINKAIESLKRYHKIKTLLLFNYNLQHVPSAFFSSFELLTTLDLSGSCIVELPELIQHARGLRYLDLSLTEINRLPEMMCWLLELQTLRLKGCLNLFELPDRITKLKNLRHLEFDFGQLYSMPRGMGKLTKLRTLYAFIVDTKFINGERDCNIKELKHLNNLSGELCISGLEYTTSVDAEDASLFSKKCLKSLELRWSNAMVYSDKGELDRVLHSLKPNTQLEELKIFCFPGNSLPDWISDPQYQNLVSIILYKCDECSSYPVLGQLPKLENLEVFEMNGVAIIDHQICINDKDIVSFPKLKKLTFNGMASLEMITNGDFPCLAELKISHCPNLTTLSSFPRSQSLKSLDISDCPKLQSLPVEMLSNLENLEIDECPLLRQTYSDGGEGSHMIEHVKNVWIETEYSESNNGTSTESNISDEETDED